MLLLQIEQHVRLEQAAAESFLDTPTAAVAAQPDHVAARALRGHAMTTTQPDLLAGLAGDGGRERPGARVAHSRSPRGAVLFHLGDAADSLFVVERGRIALTLPMQVRGSRRTSWSRSGPPGQTVGWSALIPPHRFTLKADGAVDTEVIALPRSALLEHFAAHPAVGYVVTRERGAVIGQRLQVFQAMWLREMQRVVELSQACSR